MKNITIIGAGGFGREVQMLIGHINAVSPEWTIAGFRDDGIEKGTMINGLPVLGRVDDLDVQHEAWAVMAIGNPVVKKKVAQQLEGSGIRWASLIHPAVIMGDRRYISIGEGTVICAGNL
ncbi:MAG: acetyltransferase, partial [Bacteroidota bacterium]